MFERYTEKARRVIFYARYEASQYGSPYIETAHLLLGLLREDAALARRVLPSENSIKSIRRKIDEHGTAGKKFSTSVDLPLTNEGKRVLAYAAEEAERLANRRIGIEHLLLGLLREKEVWRLNCSTKKESSSKARGRISPSGRGNTCSPRKPKRQGLWTFTATPGVWAMFRPKSPLWASTRGGSANGNRWMFWWNPEPKAFSLI